MNDEQYTPVLYSDREDTIEGTSAQLRCIFPKSVGKTIRDFRYYLYLLQRLGFARKVRLDKKLGKGRPAIIWSVNRWHAVELVKIPDGPQSLSSLRKKSSPLKSTSST